MVFLFVCDHRALDLQMGEICKLMVTKKNNKKRSLRVTVPQLKLNGIKFNLQATTIMHKLNFYHAVIPVFKFHIL